MRAEGRKGRPPPVSSPSIMNRTPIEPTSVSGFMIVPRSSASTCLPDSIAPESSALLTRRAG